MGDQAICQNPECGQPFVSWRGKKFCSEVCRKRAENRRLRSAEAVRGDGTGNETGDAVRGDESAIGVVEDAAPAPLEAIPPPVIDPPPPPSPAPAPAPTPASLPARARPPSRVAIMANPTIDAIEDELASGPRGVWISIDAEARRIRVARSAVKEALGRRRDVERRGAGYDEEFRFKDGAEA
jgi:hypothetical protein